MTIKAVVLDLDGTISTFNLDYKTVRAEVRGYLIKMGIPTSVLSVNENIFDMLKKAELFMTNKGKLGLIEEINKQTMNIAEKYELEAAMSTSLLPGALETLKALRKMGLKIGLCTVNSRNSTERILNQFKLDEFFDSVTTREKVTHVKPNPEHCQATLNCLGVDAAEAVVIGDSVNDILGAKDLKAIAVGLTTGFVPQEKLIDAGANYIVTSITDLPALVEKINKAESAVA